MKELFFKLKKPISLLVSLILLLSSLTPEMSEKIKDLFNSSGDSDLVETMDVAPKVTNDVLKQFYVDARLLCYGSAKDYEITGLKSIIINDQEYQLESSPIVGLFNEAMKYKYYFQAPDSFITTLKNSNSTIQLKDDNDVLYNVKQSNYTSDLMGRTGDDFLIPENVENPCLYLSDFTNQISFINGYWSNDNEVNKIGEYQYNAPKAVNIVGSSHQLSTPASSVQFSGKVYDFYNDEDLQGTSSISKGSGRSSGDYGYESYYSKLNKVLCDYYNEHNYDYYKKYYENFNDTSLVFDFAFTHGTMEDFVDSNGKYCLKLNEPDELEDSSVPLPLLDKDFLEGDNAYNAKLGEVNDAVFMFDRTAKTSDGITSVWYTLAQDTRFFYNEDGTRDPVLYKSTCDKRFQTELMPFNYRYNDEEYINEGYGMSIDVPFVMPTDNQNYTMTVSGDDYIFVYLDGRMILDLGGINSVQSSYNLQGTIDFNNQTATVNRVKGNNDYETNVTTSFSVNDGKVHTLTILQLDHNTGDGGLCIDTNLPLEKITPNAKSSYEVESVFTASEMTDNLSSFVDSLNFKNKVEVDAPHYSGEMNIITAENVSLFDEYDGSYLDRSYYEEFEDWSYNEKITQIDKSVKTVDLTNKEIYASVGIMYIGDTTSENIDSQTSVLKKTIIDVDGEQKDASHLFETTVTHYQSDAAQSGKDGLYPYSKFLIGSTTDADKKLHKYEESERIPSINNPGTYYNNYAWTNKTVIKNKMKTGSFTVGNKVVGNKYDFLMDKDTFTYRIYYLDVDNVFGTLPLNNGTYNGEDCIIDTLTLKVGEQRTFNVPVGIRCVVVEEDIEDYENTTKVKNGSNDKKNDYYDFKVTAKSEKKCEFTNKYIGTLKESKHLTVSIKWIDGSNNLKTRPDISVLKPVDLYEPDAAERDSSLTSIVFMGEDEKWHFLSEIFDDCTSSDMTTKFRNLLQCNVTNGDTNEVTVKDLPKFALPYMSTKIGDSILEKGSEIRYGLLQRKYGNYIISPMQADNNVAIQTNGESIINKINGSLTINTYGGDGSNKNEPLDNVEFSLYSSKTDAIADENSIADFVTKNGTASKESLEVGTYWLVETKGLSGYENNNNKPLKVELSFESMDDLNNVIDIFNLHIVRDIKITEDVDVRNSNIPEQEYKEQEFDFNIQMNKLTAEQEYVFELSSEESDEVLQKKYTARSDGSLSVDFKLKDDQTVTLKDIPNGTAYVITEKASENYIPSYTVVHNSEALIEKAQDSKTSLNVPLSTAVEVVDMNEKYDDKAVNFVFKNIYSDADYTLPNSGNSKKLIFIILSFCGFMGFGFMYILSGVRKKSISDRLLHLK